MLFAIISPILWAAMNVVDKYVISHKVKHTAGYIPVAGIANHILCSNCCVIFELVKCFVERLYFSNSCGRTCGCFNIFLSFNTKN